jgi:hypothetical protein
VGVGKDSGVERRIISREEAHERGEARYCTGVPCKHGHVAERWTSTSVCIDCMREWRRANPDRIREHNRHRENKGLRNRENREKTRERQKLRIANKLERQKLRIANSLGRVRQSPRNLENERRRTEARQQGLKRYRTDTPCKNGHLARYVRDGKCCECRKQMSHRYQARRYAANSDAVKQRLREYQFANPERYRKATKKWRANNPDRVRGYGRRAAAVRRDRELHEPRVYFVRVEKHIKIGVITNIQARLRQFRAASAEEITVLLTMPGDRKLERDLHDLLQEDRVRLEFFRDSWFIGEFIRRAALEVCNNVAPCSSSVSDPEDEQRAA